MKQNPSASFPKQRLNSSSPGAGPSMLLPPATASSPASRPPSVSAAYPQQPVFAQPRCSPSHPSGQEQFTAVPFSLQITGCYIISSFVPDTQTLLVNYRPPCQWVCNSLRVWLLGGTLSSRDERKARKLLRTRFLKILLSCLRELLFSE